MTQKCCDTDEKDASQKIVPVGGGAKKHEHKEGENHDHEDDDHDEGDGHDHGGKDNSGWKSHIPLLSSLAILAVMLTLEFGFKFKPKFPLDLIIYVITYLLAGYNVL